MKLYLAIQEISIAHKSDKVLLDGWVNSVEIGMIYRKGNKFYRIETAEDIAEMETQLLSGKIINCSSTIAEDEQPRLCKVHIVEKARPKRGEYYLNCFSCMPQLYEHDYEYSVFDPGKCSYDDRVVLQHHEMTDPLETANYIVGKDLKYFDDRNKFKGKIENGTIKFL